MNGCQVIEGDCLEVMRTLPDTSVDAVITDPPYPMIRRSYGVWTEEEWWTLMVGVCREVRRVLKPSGSAVFILQPNSRKVGSMRGWLWRFMLWVTEEWNMVQDVWWWNCTMLPDAHSIQGHLLRASVKACVWCGPASCWRDQDAVLWSESDDNRRHRAAQRANKWSEVVGSRPCGRTVNDSRAAEAAERRGGVTPFNLLPCSNNKRGDDREARMHGASTPSLLLRWWTRYICPPGGTVLDPFAGSGTAGTAAMREGRNAILIERKPEYVQIIHKRLAEEQAKTPLFAAKDVT